MNYISKQLFSTYNITTLPKSYAITHILKRAILYIEERVHVSRTYRLENSAIKEMYTRGVFVAILEAMNHNTNQFTGWTWEFGISLERRALGLDPWAKLEAIKYHPSSPV